MQRTQVGAVGNHQIQTAPPDRFGLGFKGEWLPRLVLTFGLVTMQEGASAGAIFTTLVSLDGNTTRGEPHASLVRGVDGNFYGTMSSGDAIFRVTPTGGFTNLHSFKSADGSLILAPLTPSSDGNFYGTTILDGAYGCGTVFRISPTGDFAVVHSFKPPEAYQGSPGGVVQGSDGALYGTTFRAGAAANATGGIFKIAADGTYSNLFFFGDGTKGEAPIAGLVQGNDGELYGVAYAGGPYGAGTVFRITTAGKLTSIYSFTRGDDGAGPYARLILGADGDFYGTASDGGNSNYGTIFKISAEGDFTVLHRFIGLDGAHPLASLTQGIDGAFYGTTSEGGAAGLGSIFKITTSGEFTSLYSFTNGPDGRGPCGGLAQGLDGKFYGTSCSGGARGFGVIFSLSIEAVAPPTLKGPDGGLVAKDGKFGFEVMGVPGLQVIVEACSDSAHSTWTTALTGTLVNGSLDFSDPQWTNSTARFYRVRVP